MSNKYFGAPETLFWSISSLLAFPRIAYGYALLDIRQDEKARMLHYLDTLNLFAYVSILIVIVCTIWLFKHKRVRFVHETGLAILYGLIVGAIIRYAGSETEISQLSVVPKNASQVNGTLMHVMPPDMLWIELNVSLLPRETLVLVSNDTSHMVVPNNWKGQSYDTRSYAYVFQGELNSKPQSKKILEKATFDPEIFFNLILPVIVFNAGYSLKRKFFFRNIGAIMTYAFIGTTISCFVVGLVMKLLVIMMPVTLAQFTLTDCLYFGAIISATDPVTVLAIFNDLKVDVTLHALVFGESILNDVISIVLASSIDSFSKHYGAGVFSAMYWALVNFMSIFVFSLFQGSAIGCFTALLTKFTKLCDHPMLESTLFVLMSYASFLIAEALELSGIVSVLFCGICQAHYTYNNLSPESRVRTKSLFEMCNFIAENFIFAYIGVSIFTFPQHLWSFWFIVFTFTAIALGRALNIYPLSYFLNLGRNNKIPIEFQHVQFLSGLRGAMAFALAIRNTLTEPRRMMLTSTSVVSITSVIFCGSTIQPLLQHFFIPTQVEEMQEFNENSRFSGLRAGSGSNGLDGVSEQGPHTPIDDLNVGQTMPKSVYEKAWLVRKWYNFDTGFMKPLLTHARPSLMETLPGSCGCCMPIARLLTSTQQMSNTEFQHRRMNEEESEDEDVTVIRGSFESLHRRALQMESGTNAAFGSSLEQQIHSSSSSSRSNQPILTLSLTASVQENGNRMMNSHLLNNTLARSSNNNNNNKDLV